MADTTPQESRTAPSTALAEARQPETSVLGPAGDTSPAEERVAAAVPSGGTATGSPANPPVLAVPDQVLGQFRAVLDALVLTTDAVTLPGQPPAGGVPGPDASVTELLIPALPDAPLFVSHALDAAELLSRFLPFDTAGFRAEVDGFLAAFDASGQDAEDTLAAPEAWVAAAVAAVAAGVYSARRRAKARPRAGRPRATDSQPGGRLQPAGRSRSAGGSGARLLPADRVSRECIELPASTAHDEMIPG